MTHAFRFGVQANGPSDHDGWVALAQKAEPLGYSTLSMADHFSNPLAPMPALAVAAAATSALRVGTMVACNDFRHPAVLAADAATVDHLSGGRLELGIGAGWMLTDYEQTGITLDFTAQAQPIVDNLATRVPRCREHDHRLSRALHHGTGPARGLP